MARILIILLCVLFSEVAFGAVKPQTSRRPVSWHEVVGNGQVSSVGYCSGGSRKESGDVFPCVRVLRGEDELLIIFDNEGEPVVIFEEKEGRQILIWKR